MGPTYGNIVAIINLPDDISLSFDIHIMRRSGWKVLKIVWSKQDRIKIQEKTQDEQMWQIDINNLLLHNYYCALFVHQHIKSHTLSFSR
jgi:hypothetical protein